MSNTREAVSISGVPCGEEAVFYGVGKPYFRPDGNTWKVAGTVTRITVTDDLPGLHCNLERVRVFDGDTMIFEAPLHSLEGVCYAPPPALSKAEGREEGA